MQKIFIFVLMLSVFMMQGCSKSSSKDATEVVTVESSLPFPPIDNYDNLDDELKPPSLTK